MFQKSVLKHIPTIHQLTAKTATGNRK